MSFNWRQAGAAMGGSIANIGNTMLTAEVQRMRDEQMQKFQRAEREAGQAFTLQRDAQEQQSRGLISQAQINADMHKYQMDRENELADMETQQANELEQIRLRAELDPRASNVTVNNDMTGSLGAVRGKKAQEALGKVDSDKIATINQAASSAVQDADYLSVMEDILSQSETGVVPDLFAQFGRVLGTDEAAAKEVFDAMTNRLTLAIMAQQAGPQTEADMRMIKSTQASFGRSGEANKVLLGLARKYIGRALDRKQALDEYMQGDYYLQNGHLGQFKEPHALNARTTAQTESNIDASNNPAATVYDQFNQWKQNNGRY